jgi:predicted site-specific integrase-resolvase
MKLSQYAKKVGVTYRTAFRWWQNGQIQGYQLPAGTIVVTAGEERQESRTGQVVIYARVSSHQLRANLERQAERLEAYCAAKGYQVSRVVKEIDSGVNDNRAKFLALLEDQRIHTIVVEHKDRATRFGFRYLETLLKGQGRRLEVVNLADLVSIVYSFAARLYGQRRAKRKTEAIVKQLQEADDECSWRNNMSLSEEIRAMAGLTRQPSHPKICGTWPTTLCVSPSSSSTSISTTSRSTIS